MRISRPFILYNLQPDPDRGSDNLQFVCSQELGQHDISVLRKAELRDRLGVIRKIFDKQTKEREATMQKAVCIRFHPSSYYILIKGSRRPLSGSPSIFL